MASKFPGNQAPAFGAGYCNLYLAQPSDGKTGEALDSGDWNFVEAEPVRTSVLAEDAQPPTVYQAPVGTPLQQLPIFNRSTSAFSNSPGGFSLDSGASSNGRELSITTGLERRRSVSGATFNDLEFAPPPPLQQPQQPYLTERRLSFSGGVSRSAFTPISSLSPYPQSGRSRSYSCTAPAFPFSSGSREDSFNGNTTTTRRCSSTGMLLSETHSPRPPWPTQSQQQQQLLQPPYSVASSMASLDRLPSQQDLCPVLDGFERGPVNLGSVPAHSSCSSAASSGFRGTQRDGLAWDSYDDQMAIAADAFAPSTPATSSRRGSSSAQWSPPMDYCPLSAQTALRSSSSSGSLVAEQPSLSSWSRARQSPGPAFSSSNSSPMHAFKFSNSGSGNGVSGAAFSIELERLPLERKSASYSNVLQDTVNAKSSCLRRTSSSGSGFSLGNIDWHDPSAMRTHQLREAARSDSCSSGSLNAEDFFGSATAYAASVAAATAGSSAGSLTAAATPSPDHTGSSSRRSSGSASGSGGTSAGNTTAASPVPDVSGGRVYRIKFKRTSDCFAPAVGMQCVGELAVGDCVKVEADRGEHLGCIEAVLTLAEYTARTAAADGKHANGRSGRGGSGAAAGDDAATDRSSAQPSNTSRSGRRGGRRRREKEARLQQLQQQDGSADTATGVDGSDDAAAAAAGGDADDCGGSSGSNSSSSVHKLKCIVRRASRSELSKLDSKLRDEATVLETCSSKVNARCLPMTVEDAEYQFDRKKLTFFYKADRRIDFRELVRDLFSTYKARIWMENVKDAPSAAAAAAQTPTASTTAVAAASAPPPCSLSDTAVGSHCDTIKEVEDDSTSDAPLSYARAAAAAASGVGSDSGSSAQQQQGRARRGSMTNGSSCGKRLFGNSNGNSNGSSSTCGARWGRSQSQ